MGANHNCWSFMLWNIATVKLLKQLLVFYYQVNTTRRLADGVNSIPFESTP